MAGKGDKPRIKNRVLYRNNYDIIDWGHQPKEVDNPRPKVNIKDYERKKQRTSRG